MKIFKYYFTVKKMIMKKKKINNMEVKIKKFKFERRLDIILLLIFKNII